MVLPIRVSFPTGDVEVFLPSGATTIRVNLLTPAGLETMRAYPTGFHPFRLVTNIKMADTAQPNLQELVFSKPVEVRVHYTKNDMDIAEAACRLLSLGYWDGTRWIRYSKRKHHFELQPDPSPLNGGWGVVKVFRWGDPPHAWGT